LQIYLLGTHYCEEPKTKTDWADFINEISLQYPAARKITLVMDNFKTHVSGALYEKYPQGKFIKMVNQSNIITV
jgi:hypothetical protein